MSTIAVKEVLDQLPVSEVEASLNEFLAPMMERLPDKRLGRAVPLAVGIDRVQFPDRATHPEQFRSLTRSDVRNGARSRQISCVRRRETAKEEPRCTVWRVCAARSSKHAHA